ncbi:MAG: YHS domain-containing protein [Phycisphaerales bacterium]|nr:YHS domain-containing protein [Phycisphaerales bacterium]
MSSTNDLELRIREKLQAAELKRRTHADHMRQRMEELDSRTARFNEVAAPLLESVIRPRVKALADQFENARLVDTERGHCPCTFQHTDRFPASVQLDVFVTADGHLESLLVCYRLEILPVFFQFNGHDQRTFPLDQVDEQQVATWVDTKLTEFVDTYLRLENADAYQRENMIRDPVCGMAINKNWAAASAEHAGRTYYFCIEECRRRFEQEPERYAGRD